MTVITRLGTFFLTVFSQIPMAVVLGFSAALAILVSESFPLTLVVHYMFAGVNSFTLVSIPMFILAARLLNETGSTERIFEFANCLVGHIKGGLGHANVLASIIFAGISGSAVADSAGLGRIEIEAMQKEGYDLAFSSAITVASSVIGPIIPPSIPMVIYGAMVGESVVKLFAGGIIPGLLMGVGLMIVVYMIAARDPDFPRRERASLSTIWHAFKDGFLALITPIIILGGIFSGIYTPTEASVAAVLYVLVLDLFVYKELSLADYRRIFLETVIDSGAIVIIISCANVFGWVLAIERIPNILVNLVIGITTNKYLVLLIVCAILLFLGCFIEGIAIMVILIPVLVPLVTQVGVDPIHFGVLMTLVTMIGVITPPMGMSLFVVCNITGLSVFELARATVPFFIPLVVVAILLILFPQLVMFLPNLL